MSSPLPPSEPSVKPEALHPAQHDSTPYTDSALTDNSQNTPQGKGRSLTFGTAPRAANTSFGDGGRYLLLEQIAVGGMGVVYKARQRDLDRVVALKMIHPSIVLSESRLLRFEREARAAARLHHAHIVSIFDVGKWEGQPYYTMQYAVGGSLGDRRQHFTPDAAALLVEKVARALQHAHDRSVLHRDLKPSNILLDEQGEPLIGDFGLAKIWDSDVELTCQGELVGTPAYMAPEQAEGSSEALTGAVDVWAVGVILYELLTGRRPFWSKSRDEVLTQIRSQEPPAPRSLAPEVDPRLEAIVLRCLEKDPTRRYTAGELADDLARFKRGEPTRRHRDRWPERAWRYCRRKIREIGLFRLLVVVILVLILLRVWILPPPLPPPPPGAPPPGAPPPGAPPPPWMRPPPR
jgi:serine/threonine-protein kinase